MATSEQRRWKPRTRGNSIYGHPKAANPFKLSRSKLESFYNCARCFWVDRRGGMGRPGIPAFTLNSLVDTLLKREFDRHRSAGTPHPYMVAAGLDDMVPLAHPSMDEWRNNFRGVSAQKHGLEITGAVDDVWRSERSGVEQWHVVDYKSTATTRVLNADAMRTDIYKQAYIRQLAIYQWLFREAGHPISTLGFFVYENGDQNAEGLAENGASSGPRGIPLCEVRVIPIDTAIDAVDIKGEQIGMEWIDQLVANAKECLDEPAPRSADPNCEYCAYREAISAAYP